MLPLQTRLRAHLIRTLTVDMSLLELFSATEQYVRPAIARLPHKLAVKMFSSGRTWFSHQIAAESISRTRYKGTPITVAGVKFNAPLYNAAGMFKYGEGYDVVARQGAGAYVAGTTTSLPRDGNTKLGIQWPALSLASSGNAINWMGLPNEGHTVVAARLARLQRIQDCPIGASVSADPLMPENQALPGLVHGLQEYARANVDFIELNESCPNVPGHANQNHHLGLDDALLRRLEYVHTHFLTKLHRHLPVFVKFSVDTNPEQLHVLLDTLISMKYSGIILGNTSTQYDKHLHTIREQNIHHEADLLHYFIQNFGGGISGRVLQQTSLELAAAAQKIVAQKNTLEDFAVIRCGGVSSVTDVYESEKQGIRLQQWYTGYYKAFAKHGHNVYAALFSANGN